MFDWIIESDLARLRKARNAEDNPTVRDNLSRLIARNEQRLRTLRATADRTV